MSVLTHSDQVFLGLPLLLALGIIILVMEFMHEEERATCPYHLKRLVWRAAVTSCIPNIAQSESEDTSSSSLTPHIQRTIDTIYYYDYFITFSVSHSHDEHSTHMREERAGMFHNALMIYHLYSGIVPLSGFQERGFICIKAWGFALLLLCRFSRFSASISFFLNIP